MAKTKQSSLWVDIHIVPAYHAETGYDDPLKQLWSPTSITLIHTATSALVIDVPPTIAETEALPEWIEKVIPKKELKYFFTTHAHGGHFLGFPVLQKTFPVFKANATADVAEGAKTQYDPEIPGGPWTSWFPNGQLPDVKVVFEACRSQTLSNWMGTSSRRTTYPVVRPPTAFSMSLI